MTKKEEKKAKSLTREILEWILTIVVAIVYCIYLGKIKEDVKKNEN